MSLVAKVVEELNEIVGPDGAEFLIRTESLTGVVLELDLSRAECPECVVPKSFILEIIRSRLSIAAPDIATVDLIDARENGLAEGSRL